MAKGPIRPIDQQAFDTLVGNHSAWFQSAHQMLRVAELIWPAVERGHIALDKYQKAASVRSRAETVQARSVPISPISLVVLTDFIGSGGAYMMNAGYAVENFLKAVRVKRLTIGGVAVRFNRTRRRIRDEIPTDHEYVLFAGEELNAPLTPAEMTLLERLRIHVEWAGRYPVCLSPDPVGQQKAIWLQSQDRAEINAFCRRLEDTYKALG